MSLDKVLNMLKESTPGAEISNEMLFLRDRNLHVKASIERAEEDSNGAIIVIYFWLHHPSFEEPLFETAAAVGSTLEHALENAVKSFYAGIYTAVIEYLEGDSDNIYTTDFFGTEKQWDVVTSDLVLMGNSDSSIRNSYWDMLKDKLGNHIGNRSLYYVKVFTSKQGNENIVCECRVNDIASQELSSEIYEYVKSWDVSGFHSQKQFFFISQRSAFTPYPYSKKQIEGFVAAAVEVFDKCNSDEAYERLEEDINKITHDYDLAVELRNLMPEMCAEYHFEQFNYSEYITLHFENQEDIPVAKDRFTPYYWIRNKLIDGFKNDEFPESAYARMVSLSAIYNAYEQIQQKEKETGTEMKGVKLNTGMYVPEGYIVR